MPSSFPSFPESQAPAQRRRESAIAGLELAGVLALLTASAVATAQTPPVAQMPPAAAQTSPAAEEAQVLPAIKATGRQEAMDEAPPAYPGGQVGLGARLGVLGNTPVLDAPFNVTGYTAQTIENEQARSMADVLAVDPSVRMATARSNINEDFTIRGFPVSSQDFALNGMYGLTPYWRTPVEMAEQIEVLKGPAAMLNGMPPSGNIGGMINIVPKRAGSEPLTRVTGSYLSDSIFGAHLDVGRRFGPGNAFGMRLNVAGREGDTTIDHQSVRETLGSLGFDFHQPRVRVSADLIWAQQHVDGLVRQLQVAPTLTAVPRVPANSTSYPGLGWTQAQDGTAVVRGEYDLAEAITAYIGYGQRRNNWDAVAANPVIQNVAGDYTFAGGWQRQHVTSKSFEAGLRGTFKTGAVGHKATLGYTKVDQEQMLGFYTGFPAGQSNLYTGQLFPTPAIDGITNPLYPYLSVKLASVALSDTLSLLQERLLLTLGVRRQGIEAQNYNFATGAPSGPFYDRSATTPAVGIVYKLRPNVSLYANYIEGLSRGDTAPVSGTIANPGEMLAPYKTKQKEIGTKVEWGRLMTTVSLFELTRPSASVSNNVFAVNGEQRNRGIEASVFGEAVRGVRLLGGVTLMQGEITESPNAALRDKDAIGVPRLQANIGAEWDTGFVPGLTLTGRWLHTGTTWMDAANTLKVPSWNRFDVGARYAARLGGKPVLFRLSVENLLDKDYYGVSTFGYLFLGTPRTLMLSATVDL
ncbi:MAG: TonB-dependent receptor [Burkholderiales bacterium 70-64]|nr:MAG: TonB-dependent receptor [Burkholderiales bacterium 70-64]